MKAPPRNKVVFLGKIPPSGLTSELSTRNLDLVPEEDRDKALELCRSNARALLVPFSDVVELKKQLIHAKKPALDAGVMLAVVFDGKPVGAQKSVTQAISSLESDNKSSRIGSYSLSNLTALAQDCAEHQAGRPEKPDLKIECSGINPDFSSLFKRAFNDFSTIELHPLDGGLSGSGGVWRVIAKDELARKRVPFVAKIDFLDNHDVEINNVREFVVEQIPFPNHPPHLIDRCIKGVTFGIFVSAFVERADRLDEYLKHGGSAPLAIAALFDGPLRIWRANARDEGEVGLLTEYQRYRVLPSDDQWVEKFDQPYRTAKTNNQSVSSPGDVLRDLKSIPNIATHVCRSHGDLHARNIFVRRNGSDIVLIDFAKTQYESPTSRDPAFLDVTLAFGFSDETDRLSLDQIRKLYSDLMLRIPHSLCSDERIEAMRQVRLHMRGSGTSTNEALFSIAAYLLWRAKLDSKDYAYRGLAYELAIEVISNLKNRTTKVSAKTPASPQAPSPAPMSRTFSKDDIVKKVPKKKR